MKTDKEILERIEHIKTLSNGYGINERRIKELEWVLKPSKLRQGCVTSRYFFFNEGKGDGWTFEVEAKDHEEAFDKAYAMWGPQVEDMYYRVI